MICERTQSRLLLQDPSAQLTIWPTPPHWDERPGINMRPPVPPEHSASTREGSCPEVNYRLILEKEFLVAIDDRYPPRGASVRAACPALRLECTWRFFARRLGVDMAMSALSSSASAPLGRGEATPMLAATRTSMPSEARTANPVSRSARRPDGSRSALACRSPSRSERRTRLPRAAQTVSEERVVLTIR